MVSFRSAILALLASEANSQMLRGHRELYQWFTEPLPPFGFPSAPPPTTPTTPTAPTPSGPPGHCSNTEIVVNDNFMQTMSTIRMPQDMMNAFEYLPLYQGSENNGYVIGGNMQFICEANDANHSGTPTAPIEDGMSGDTNWPWGNLKILATPGERSACDESLGKKLAGVPDGVGAYLPSDSVVRIVIQSESYGPIEAGESYPYYVNNATASFTGSHVFYIDYDREMLSTFMENDLPASTMVVGFGEMIDTLYNLKGEPVGPRNRTGATEYGAHFGNCDADGNYAVALAPTEADWLMMSLCSAHLDAKHQWGENLGFEDDIFMTNEEWQEFAEGSMFVGLSYIAVDIATKTAYTVGALGQGGFEKSSNFDSQHPEYVMIALSGYNGDFANNGAVLDARNAEYGMRPDGTPYPWPENIIASNFYLGLKGKMEDGSDADADDFLARNGLRYGKIYGFATDMSSDGPTKGLYRDDFHQDESLAYNGAKVTGKWLPLNWTWDGVVKNFQHDIAWQFTIPPPAAVEGSEYENYRWWTSNGTDYPGLKCEHVTPDPRAGVSGFIVGSTLSWFGHAYVENVPATWAALPDGQDFPDEFDASYYVYQGTLDGVHEQIMLGGAGLLPGGRNATYSYAKGADDPRPYFISVDGFEMYIDNGQLVGVFMEDAGNVFGDRLFIAYFEHEDDGKELTYYFVAMTGGKLNSRLLAGVGIPKGSNCGAGSHEWSGSFDLSGLLYKNDDGSFAVTAADDGAARRKYENMTATNDKYIYVGLQAHTMACGIVSAFQADRSGHMLVYQPNIPTL